MAIFVFLISSDSSKDSVGTSTARVFLFGMICTAISAIVPIIDPPVVHDDTSLIPTETLTIPPVVSTLPHTSVFLVTARSSPPSSPTHDLSPTGVTPPTLRQILPAPPELPHRPAFLVLSGQAIPFGRLYSTQPNGVRKMLTMRKRVRALPVGRSSFDSPSDFSSDSSSGHSLLDSSFDVPATISVRLSRKRCRSPAASVPLATSVPRALSLVRVDLLPPRKRIRGDVTEFDSNDSIEESYEAYTKPNINFDVQAYIDVDIAAADATAAREADVEVEVRIGSDREEEASLRIEAPLRLERIWIGVLERDNMRLQGMLCVERERVNSLRRHVSYTQEELRHVRVSRYYDRAEFRRLETFTMRGLGYRPTMPTATRTRMVPTAIEEMIERSVAEASEAYEVNRNRGPTMESVDEHEDDNGDDNGNDNGDGGGNGNRNGLGGGNGNGNPNVHAGGVVPVARSKFMDNGEECLDGWVGADGGEVKGVGVDFGVSRTLFGEVLRKIIKESGGEVFGVDRGAV
nr:hypothetical protein [Tanacetum cinerariifolium]